MKTSSLVALLPILLSGYAAATTGCASTMKLRYQEPPAATSTRGDIELVFEDRRPSDRGGDEPARVGTIRNAFGMPFPLKADPSREPSRVVRQLVSECLAATGYRVVEASQGTPLLLATLQTFWTDGYQHSRMILNLPLELKRDESAEPVWSHELVSNVGVTWTAGYGQFDRGFTAMLEAAKQMLLAEFASADFREAIQSLR